MIQATHFIGEMVILEYLLSEEFRLLLVPIALFFVSCYLWESYFLSLKDENSKLPLPPGKMGFPLVGEMFHFLLWVSVFITLIGSCLFNLTYFNMPR